MRIALVVPEFPKLSETFIVRHFLSLIEAGHDAFVICRTSGEEDWRRVPALAGRSDLRRRVRSGWPASSRLRAALLFPLAFVRAACKNPSGSLRYLTRGAGKLGSRLPVRFYLDAELIACRPDIVHFEFGALARERPHLGELLGCRTAVSFRGHDLDHIGLGDPAYYRAVFAEGDAFHFLGRHLERTAERRGLSREKTRMLISPAVDCQRFQRKLPRYEGELGGKTRPCRILSVGRLHWAKGYEFALQAVHRLRRAGVELEYRIAGDGGYREEAAFWRHKLGLEDCVSFLGAAGQDEVRRQLEWADVFLHAAQQEGFGNAVLEAQAMELPVVASDAGGLPEAVEHSVTGFVVPRRDARRLADAVQSLCRDPELRLAMGRLGRQRALARFNPASQTAAFEELYRRVGNRPPAFAEGLKQERASGSERVPAA